MLAHDVGGQQVGRELDAAKIERHGFGQGGDEGRFAQSRDAFEQHVAAGDDGDEHVFDDAALADDEAADLLRGAVEGLDELFGPGLGGLGVEGLGVGGGGPCGWAWGGAGGRGAGYGHGRKAVAPGGAGSG